MEESFNKLLSPRDCPTPDHVRLISSCLWRGKLLCCIPYRETRTPASLEATGTVELSSNLMLVHTFPFSEATKSITTASEAENKLFGKCFLENLEKWEKIWKFGRLNARKFSSWVCLYVFLVYHVGQKIPAHTFYGRSDNTFFVGIESKNYPSGY